MLRQGIVHSQLAASLARLRHTDLFAISDSGFPVPPGVEVIDLAVVYGLPSFEHVLDAVLAEVLVEEATIATETTSHNPRQAERIRAAVGEVTDVSHEELKKMAASARFIIRTGEATPFSNVILRAGVRVRMTRDGAVSPRLGGSAGEGRSVDGETWLVANGPRIETASGKPVTLRGVGLGGWMNMENFITGHASTETLQRQALLAVLREASYDRFFTRLLDVFFMDEDAAFLASLGLNCVRLPVNYHHFEHDMAPMELLEDGFRLLDRAIERCARHGLYTVIDLHALPGAQNQHWHSDNPTHRALLWQHKHFQDRAINLWEALADRYKDNPWVAGYNLVNEPGDPNGASLRQFYGRLRRAIRAIDPDHLLFLDGNRYGTDFSVFEETWPNTVYGCHDYALPGFADGGPYPGVSRGRYFDRTELERVFQERARFMLDANVPIWVGEFGPVYTGDAARDAMRYRLLADQTATYERHGASWSLWTYKDIGLQGLVYASRNSPYMQRIAPVVAKKKRLGIDAWGSTGDELADVMRPILVSFEKEYPSFDPYPFGRGDWIATLVKQILFAEPLVDEFAACFAGATDEDLDACADSFALRSCERREHLLEVLADACAASAKRSRDAANPERS